jgi:hypothetical protein
MADFPVSFGTENKSKRLALLHRIFKPYAEGGESKRLDVRMPPQPYFDCRSKARQGEFEFLRESKDVQIEGVIPPMGIFIEFSLIAEPDVLLKGAYTPVGEPIGPFYRNIGGFAVLGETSTTLYEFTEVCKWRQINDYAEFTPAMLKLVETSVPNCWTQCEVTDMWEASDLTYNEWKALEYTLREKGKIDADGNYDSGPACLRT